VPPVVSTEPDPSRVCQTRPVAWSSVPRQATRRGQGTRRLRCMRHGPWGMQHAACGMQHAASWIAHRAPEGARKAPDSQR
jgi:hypothetical protein